MAVVTTKVRTICESVTGYDYKRGNYPVKQILEQAAPKIFDFDFPIYDESHRLELEVKILRHYYMREIGAETVGLWKLFMEDRLNEIMPKYNELYRLEAEKISPAYTVWRKRQYNHVSNSQIDRTTHTDADSSGKSNSGTKVTGTDTVTATANIFTYGNTDSSGSVLSDTVTKDDTDTANNRKAMSGVSDTPQGAVGNLENYSYLSEAKIEDIGDTGHTYGDGSSNTETSTSEDSSNEQTTEENRGEVKGIQSQTDVEATNNNKTTTDTSGAETGENNEEGNDLEEGFYGKSYAELVAEVSKLWVNIDNEIVKDMEECFLSIWYPATTSY